jgi:1,4-dihydroxy-2-naphthoate polyprenyltransferase
VKHIRGWLKASRLASQLYIFLPLLVGQMFHVMRGGTIDWSVFAIVHLFGLFLQLYIVYANDYADRDTDALNTTFTRFSGGSRVLVDGQLSARSLRSGALVMALLALGTAILLALARARYDAVPIGVLSLGLLWLYSYPPARLSYRGGGEVLQMIGVGLILPLLGYYAQSGQFARFPWPTLLCILPTQLSCAIATSLPDQPSDRASSKRTAAVLLGETVAKLLVMALNAASILSFLAIEWGPRIENARAGFVLLPTGATVAALFVFKSRPGTYRLTIFVTLAVFTTLSVMAGVAGVVALLVTNP